MKIDQAKLEAFKTANPKVPVIETEVEFAGEVHTFSFRKPNRLVLQEFSQAVAYPKTPKRPDGYNIADAMETFMKNCAISPTHQELDEHLSDFPEHLHTIFNPFNESYNALVRGDSKK